MRLEKLTIELANEGLSKKEFSCTELTRGYLDKIKKENKELNDFLLVTEKLALEQAKNVDNKISKKEKIGPLEGIPIAFKDNILVKDEITTAGSKILEKYKAPYDAFVTEKLKKAGVVIIGKTNLDEFAMGASTENSAFGVVRNPHDKTRVAGGSSGGSVVAVAANHCLGALGSDTGGSIRQPSAFCGVIGFKPSYGMVSRNGLIAMASSLDQIGPIGKTIKDVKLLFETIRGKDPKDLTTIDLKSQKNPKSQIPDIKIGIPKEYFGEGIDPDVKQSMQKVIKEFEDIGFELVDVSLSNPDYALAVYYIIVPAEVSANLARYDGIKYGFSRKQNNLLKNYLQTRAEGFGDEVRRRIMLGTYVLSAGYRDAYYNKAQKVRALIKKEFEEVFKQVDLVITPTTPTPAFKIGEKEDPLSMYLADIYTVTANLAGLPAISIPYRKARGLPVGFQILGPQFRDDLVLEAASTYEQVTLE